MATIELDSSEQWRVINALHTAAETYEADANKITTPGFAKQFREQAKHARELAEKIAQA